MALTAVLTVTSTAGGWTKPSTFAVSTPAGGELQVCRDGIKFQVAFYSTAPWHYKVYSPPLPPVVDSQVIDNATVVAAGEVVPQPHFPILPEQFSTVGTATQKWNSGQLLQPSPNALDLVLGGPVPGSIPPTGDFSVRYDIQDCYLFPPKSESQCKEGGWRRWAFKNQGRCIAYVQSQAREACIAERAAGPAQFRTKYGKGEQRRHALRRCIRSAT